MFSVPIISMSMRDTWNSLQITWSDRCLLFIDDMNKLTAFSQTFDGGYKPFNRSGISTSSSPFLKASYETTGAFLSDATLDGDYDDLTTPSSRIVIGRPNLSGTGSFDIVQPVLEQS